MKPIVVKMNPHRVCAAIAKIGYEPHSALMDIIDNSVAAKAKNVRVEVKVREGMLPGNKKSADSYLIVDDGIGMDNSQILNALKLGSDDNYDSYSLSKYGMGLKSAGMSLGWRIEVVSKKDQVVSNRYILDQEMLKDQDDYIVFEEVLTAEESVEIDKIIASSSGTMIKISKVHSSQSAKLTSEKLRTRIGVVYFGFLAEKDVSKKLNIEVVCPGIAQGQIPAFDILFRDVAQRGFDPDK